MDFRRGGAGHGRPKSITIYAGIATSLPGRWEESFPEESSISMFLDSPDWREWPDRDATEFGRMAIDAFIGKVGGEGFKTSRQIPVGDGQALYRLALFSRNALADKILGGNPEDR